MEDCEKSYDKIAKEIKNLQKILELKKDLSGKNNLG